MLVSLPPRMLDLDDGRVLLEDGSALSLSPIEQKVLRFLVDAEGQPVSRDVLLRSVWGYAASSRTRTVDVTMRRLRAKVEEHPSEPRWLTTVYGQGYALVRPASVKEVRSLIPVLPATDLIGRDAELATLRRAMTEARITTLTGPSGAGKTTLAIAFARACQVDDTVPGGVWFVDATLARSLPDVVARIADGVGVALTGDTPDQAMECVGRVLEAHGRCLLLIDNGEQAVEALALCIPAFCAVAPQLRMLVTSQVRLAVAGEHVVSLGPLPTEHAVALLKRRGQAVRAGFGAQEKDEPALRELAERLEGLPLALELAAARAAMFDADELCARLTDRLSSLTTGRRDAPDRHTTLRAAVQWSWDLLGTDEQTALAWCTVFRGGFDLDGAEAVLGEAALDKLQALIDHSLLISNGRRFTMYGWIAEFAAAHLDDDTPVLRHRAHYLQLAEALANGEDPERLSADFDNVLMGLQGTPNEVARTVLAVELMVYGRGPHSAHKAMVQQALQQIDALEPALAVQIWRAWADFHRHSGELDQCGSALAQALSLLEGLCDPVLVDRIQGAVAMFHLVSGRTDEALEMALEALERARMPGERAWLHMRVGLVYQERGDARAQLHLRAAVERYADLGWLQRLARAQTNLGNVLADGGLLEEAEQAHRAALTYYERMKAPRRAAAVHSNLGNILLARGDAEAALASYEAALHTYRISGQFLAEGLGLTNLGCGLIGLSRFEEATTALARSIRVHNRAGAVRSEGIAWGNLAIAREMGGLEGAEEAFTQALTLLAPRDKRAAAYFYAYRGGLRQGGGASGDADFEEAERLLTHVVDPHAVQLLQLCRARARPSLAADALRSSDGVDHADVHQARTLLEQSL